MPFKDPEKRKKYFRDYMHDWRGQNRDDYNAYQRDWRRKNKGKVKAIKKRYERKLRKMGTRSKNKKGI